MEGPGVSLFQDGLDNPQSKEEDEELEEQRRRQEELEDLLTDGIQGFKYDDTTINSSTNISLASYDGSAVTAATDLATKQPPPLALVNPLDFRFDNDSTKNTSATNGSLLNVLDEIAEMNYRNANTQEEQLKVLYEVRMREINSLRQEFSNYKDDKVKEINVLKGKLTLSEAEIRHLQLSVTNLEGLLVEKTDVIKKLNLNLLEKDGRIEGLQKSLDQMKIDICSYQSTVNELQMKQMESNPFAAGTRQYQLDEVQKSQQEHISKLEDIIEEQKQKAVVMEKEKKRLEDDLKKLIKADEENNTAIIELSKKLHSSQQQCKDLFMLGEAIKRESDHFKERLKELSENSETLFADNYVGTLDGKTLMIQLEKLKRMVLDKDTELNTLKSKLKFYESDMNELFEYRELMNDIRTGEFEACSNKDHRHQLLFMQKQLQTYKELIEERNKEIMNLHLINKESREKIEEMLQQTRHDIQNLSEKYSLPQLEKMSQDLKEAEMTISELRKQLEERNDEQEKRNKEMEMELEKAHQQLNNLQLKSIDDKQNFEEMLAMLKRDLKNSEDEIDNHKRTIEELKQVENELRKENSKIHKKLDKACIDNNIPTESDTETQQFKSLKSEYGLLKEQLAQLMKQLEKSKSKENDLGDSVKVILKLKTKISEFAESLGDTVSMKTSDLEDSLKSWQEILSSLVDRLQHSKNSFRQAGNVANFSDSNLESKCKQICELQNLKTTLENEKFALEYQIKRHLQELEEARNSIGDLLRENNDLNIKLGKCMSNVQEIKRELSGCQNKLQVAESDKAALEKQLNELKKELDEARQESIRLQKELAEVGEKAARKNLYEELRSAENQLSLEKSTSENKGIGEIPAADVSEKIFQAEILRAELMLRERLQHESLKKLQDIEARYKKVLDQSTELYNKEIEKLKSQEINYRKQIAVILEDCSKKVTALENDNQKLGKQCMDVVREHENYKRNVMLEINKYQEKLAHCQYNLEVTNKKWEKFIDHFVNNYGTIERRCQTRMKDISTKIRSSQSQIELIEKSYNDRINKFKAKNVIKNS